MSPEARRSQIRRMDEGMHAELNDNGEVAEPIPNDERRGARLAIRPLTEADTEEVAALLHRGFPERMDDYWRRAMHRLGERFSPEGYPRFGYTLVDGDSLVGVLLTIFSQGDDGAIRGNLSSWYVEPYYRMYSSLLIAPLRKFKAATLINISPAPNTRATIEAQGFQRYVSGAFFAFAALGRRAPGVTVREVAPNASAQSSMLANKAAFGCLSLEVSDGAEVHPFVFARTRVLGYKAPIAQLVYCHSVDDFVQYAGPLGRRLLRKGFPLVRIDALGPLPGLIGVFDPQRNPKYFRGPSPPRLGDLSETEIAIFGS